MREFTANEHLKEKLKDPYFKELYELEQQKYDIVRKIIDYRIKNGLSQKELARRVGVSQQHISKIENAIFSSVVTLEKVLLAIGLTVKIRAVPLDTRTKSRISKRLPGTRQQA